jgi:hypothetical protein
LVFDQFIADRRIQLNALEQRLPHGRSVLIHEPELPSECDSADMAVSERGTPGPVVREFF